MIVILDFYWNVNKKNLNYLSFFSEANKQRIILEAEAEAEAKALKGLNCSDGIV